MSGMLRLVQLACSGPVLAKKSSSGSYGGEDCELRRWKTKESMPEEDRKKKKPIAPPRGENQLNQQQPWPWNN